jgi:hypothetical protein
MPIATNLVNTHFGAGDAVFCHYAGTYVIQWWWPVFCWSCEADTESCWRFSGHGGTVKDKKRGDEGKLRRFGFFTFRRPWPSFKEL